MTIAPTRKAIAKSKQRCHGALPIGVTAMNTRIASAIMVVSGLFICPQRKGNHRFPDLLSSGRKPDDATVKPEHHDDQQPEERGDHYDPAFADLDCKLVRIDANGVLAKTFSKVVPMPICS